MTRPSLYDPLSDWITFPMPQTKAALDSLIARLLSREAIATIVGVVLGALNELDAKNGAVLAALILGRSLVKAVDRYQPDSTDTAP